MNLRKFLLVSLVLALGSVGAGAALAQSCTPINSVPFAIGTAGKYCLTQHVRYEGPDYAISIYADDVIVDLGGYTVTAGASAAANQFSRGVLGGARENITVRNGTLRGFGIGMQLYQNAPSGSRGFVVEQMVIDNARLSGIQIMGRNPTIRDNRVLSVGSASSANSAYGIYVFGTGVRIANNLISNIASSVQPIGIYVAASGSLIQNNFISDIGNSSNLVNGIGIYVQPNVNGGLIEGNRLIQSVQAGGSAIRFSSNVANYLIDGNTISGHTYGIDLSSSPSTKYKGNTVVGASSPYLGGVNLGGNN